MEKFFEYLQTGDVQSAVVLLEQLSFCDAASILSEADDEQLDVVCPLLSGDFLFNVLSVMKPDKRNKIILLLQTDKLQAESSDSESEPDDVTVDVRTHAAQFVQNADEDSIVSLLQKRSFATLKPILASMNEVEVAHIFEDLEIGDSLLLFRLLPKDLAADVFVELDADRQEDMISRLSNGELYDVMQELFVDDIVDIIEEMPANVVRRMLAQSDAQTRFYVNEILKYPKDSAGSIMTVEFVSLSPELTVDESYERIRLTAIDKETIYTCYVIDKSRRLIGTVSAKDLLLARRDQTISEIMNPHTVYAHTTDDRESVAFLLSEYDFLAVPVVDDEMRLVGIVTIDDAIDVLQEENSEDIAKMAAVRPDDKPYLKTGVFRLWRNRIPWLLVLMVSATFTGLILNKYEHRLAIISSVLFACVPMIMDTGGNAGSQASVTVIRALALNELTTKDALTVMWKELRVSVLLGASLAVACFAKLTLIDNLIFGYREYTPFICLVVSLSLTCTVVIAKIVGCTLPLLAKKVKLDPAVVASPFITTIVDALSLMLYCALAVGLLSN